MYFTWWGTEVQHVVKSNTISRYHFRLKSMRIQFYHSHVLDSFPVEVVLLCFVQLTHIRTLDGIKKWEIGLEIRKLYNSGPCCWLVLFSTVHICVHFSTSILVCKILFACFWFHPPTHLPILSAFLTYSLMVWRLDNKKNFVQQKAQWCIYIYRYDVSLFVYVWDFVDQPLIPECMEYSGWLTKESNCCLRQELQTSAWWGLHCMDHKTCGCLPM